MLQSACTPHLLSYQPAVETQSEGSWYSKTCQSTSWSGWTLWTHLESGYLWNRMRGPSVWSHRKHNDEALMIDNMSVKAHRLGVNSVQALGIGLSPLKCQTRREHQWEWQTKVEAGVRSFQSDRHVELKSMGRTAWQDRCNMTGASNAHYVIKCHHGLGSISLTRGYPGDHMHEGAWVKGQTIAPDEGKFRLEITGTIFQKHYCSKAGIVDSDWLNCTLTQTSTCLITDPDSSQVVHFPSLVLIIRPAQKVMRLTNARLSVSLIRGTILVIDVLSQHSFRFQCLGLFWSSAERWEEICEHGCDQKRDVLELVLRPSHARDRILLQVSHCSSTPAQTSHCDYVFTATRLSPINNLSCAQTCRMMETRCHRKKAKWAGQT